MHVLRRETAFYKPPSRIDRRRGAKAAADALGIKFATSLCGRLFWAHLQIASDTNAWNQNNLSRRRAPSSNIWVHTQHPSFLRTTDDAAAAASSSLSQKQERAERERLSRPAYNFAKRIRMQRQTGVTIKRLTRRALSPTHPPTLPPAHSARSFSAFQSTFFEWT